MAAGVGRGFVDDHQLQQQHQLERQMGCMAGFFQIFERHQILAGKRLYSTRRLSSSLVNAGSTSPSEKSESSETYVLKEIHSSSPEKCAESARPPSSPLPLQVFDFKESVKSHWKLRESPRLSLDSRAIVDTKGKLRPREIRTAVPSGAASETAESEQQRRSPSVVARLMGIEALPENRSELRRSSSESRVARDPSYYRFIDSTDEMLRTANLNEFSVAAAKKVEAPARAAGGGVTLLPVQRKAFVAEDFFPFSGEVEKKLRMRGIDEPAKDLEALKQILEAMQLKGLLHGRQAKRQAIDSPIVVMRPVVSRPSRPPSVETPPPMRRSAGACRADRNVGGGNVSVRRRLAPRSPENPTSPARRRPWNAGELPRCPQPQRRISSVHSSTAKVNPKRLSPATAAVSRSPRNRRPIYEAATPKEAVSWPADDDSSTTVSDSSISSSFQLDLERSRVVEYRSGRSLLERCDKLLHSIAAFTGAAEQVAAAEQQPSPVSVLESSNFLGSDTSPSPLRKRSIDFNKELVELNDDLWSTSTPTILSADAEDEDYAYVSEILRLSLGRSQVSSNVYAVLEKRRYSSEASKAARLHRRLIFDTVTEILDQSLNVSSWESFAHANSLFSGGGGCNGNVAQVWAELQRIREEVVADDLNSITCGVIKKDMTGEQLKGWAYPATEMSDAVLYIERLIFKDLIADTIRDLADVAAKSFRPSYRRRKLEF